MAINTMLLSAMFYRLKNSNTITNQHTTAGKYKSSRRLDLLDGFSLA